MAENTVRNTIRTSAPKETKPPKEIVKQSFWGTYGERIKKISGLILMGSSVFLFFAFISYLFTWQPDQSLVSSELPANPNPSSASNWMGIIGAWASNLFIHNWFGLSSFLLIPLFFLLGYKIIFDLKKFSLIKVGSILLFFTVFISVVLAFIFSNTPELDYLGGIFGSEMQVWIRGMIGAIGLVIFLMLALLVFLVINFNINLLIPKFAFLRHSIASTEPEESLHPDPMDDDITMEDEEEENEEEEDEEEEEDTDEEINLITRKERLVHEKEINVDFEIKGLPTKTPIPSEVSNEQYAEEISNTGSWYKYPHLKLLREHKSNNAKVDEVELQQRKDLIVETLENYKIKIDKIEATIGPTVTLYEIIPAPGIRISKIKSLEDDIALSLSALGIRIIAPMPGKGTVGIEVPNKHPEMVSMMEALASDAYQNSTADLPVVLGRTISNEVYVTDLAKMPHLLMAGATGQGKSVGINTIIASILYKKHPEDVKFIMIDPKKVELSLFKKIEKHFLPELPDGQDAIITDTKMVVDVLKSLCVEMDDRYDKLKDAQVRNLKEYNKKIERGLLDTNIHKRLPYVILVIDELADLMMTAGKEVELPIARLAQLARAIGIHLIVATQRPSVNIITGVIKANFPARLAFKVSSAIDSRTILDAKGAEQLIGRGDMLFSAGNDMIRIQCPFIDTDEVEALTEFISEQPYPEPYKLHIYTEENSGGNDNAFDDDVDPLFRNAAHLIVSTQQGSTSLLQRRMKLGYNRAGRLMDQMERLGVVGPSRGSTAREVLFHDESALEQFLSSKGIY